MNWTRVIDGMPDSDTTVLVHVPIADEPVQLGYHDGELWRNVHNESFSEILTPVEHWMPLPEPPSV